MRTQSHPPREVFEPITEVLPVVPLGALLRDVAVPAPVPPAATLSGRSAQRAPEWLRVTVVGLGVVLAVGIAGLGVELARPGAFSALRAKTPLGRLVVIGPPTGASTSRPAAHRPAPATTDPQHVAAAALRSSGPSAPALLALHAAHGGPGASVTITGSGLRSPSGEIVATFDGIAASTRCPTTSECLATVPAGIPAGTVVVRVRTDGGTSNGLVLRAP